jgi:hypothetical protein
MQGVAPKCSVLFHIHGQPIVAVGSGMSIMVCCGEMRLTARPDHCVVQQGGLTVTHFDSADALLLAKCW